MYIKIKEQRYKLSIIQKDKRHIPSEFNIIHTIAYFANKNKNN